MIFDEIQASNLALNSLKCFQEEAGQRTTLLNLRRDGRILNVPLYAAFRLPAFVACAIST